MSFTKIFFSFSLKNVCLYCRLRKAYAVLRAANRFVGSEIKLNTTQETHFPRNTRYLGVDGLSNYLYLFKKEPA